VEVVFEPSVNEITGIEFRGVHRDIFQRVSENDISNEDRQRKRGTLPMRDIMFTHECKPLNDNNLLVAGEDIGNT
jgi:hypothetical protein